MGKPIEGWNCEEGKPKSLQPACWRTSVPSPARQTNLASLVLSESALLSLMAISTLGHAKLCTE